MAKEVKVTSIIRKLYVETNGKEVEVKQIDNPEDYGKDVTIYTKEAVKGKTAGTTLYAVSVKDFVPKKRVAKADAILADALAGMSAKELASKYGKQVQ